MLAQEFSATLIAELASFDAQFWVAPGARSQSLAIAAAQVAATGKTTLSVRIDERSLGFHALGAAISKKPQVIITTSGTAVANLHPAVLEAHHAGIPLILLTADRPHELRGVGANQTTNQVGIFADAVIECIDVDTRTNENSPSELARIAIERSFVSKQPIQLNLQFVEPLSNNTPDAALLLQDIETKSLLKQELTFTELSGDKAIVIAGAGAEDFVAEIAELSLPVFAEPSSGVRQLANSVIGYRELLSQQHELVRAISKVIVYGKPTLSREVIALLKNPSVEVVSRSSRMGEYRIGNSVQVVSGGIKVKAADPKWLQAWLEASEASETTNSGFNDRAIIETVYQSDLEVLVLGASEMIRVADRYAPRKEVTVWANRGLAGIDGTIATATGIAMATRAKVVALMGDLTFLHDVGSLVVDKADGAIDLSVVVVNDHGGKIFEALEVKQTVNEDLYDRVFRTGQDFNIAELAKAFGWNYLQVTNESDLSRALAANGRNIVEIVLG